MNFITLNVISDWFMVTDILWNRIHQDISHYFRLTLLLDDPLFGITHVVLIEEVPSELNYFVES